MCNVSLFTAVLFITHRYNIHDNFKHIYPIHTKRKSSDVVDFLDVGGQSDRILYLKMKMVIFI